MIVFCYGTLKKGYGLNHILQGCEYLGAATTSPEYTLLNGNNFPFLVERKGIGAKGEVYKVTSDIVNILDQVEGHPNFYERKIIRVKDDSGLELNVLAYIHPDNGYVSELEEVFEWER